MLQVKARAREVMKRGACSVVSTESECPEVSNNRIVSGELWDVEQSRLSLFGWNATHTLGNNLQSRYGATWKLGRCEQSKD